MVKFLQLLDRSVIALGDNDVIYRYPTGGGSVFPLATAHGEYAMTHQMGVWRFDKCVVEPQRVIIGNELQVADVVPGKEARIIAGKSR